MIFDWNEVKNELLKQDRNISFEEVVIALQDEKKFSIAKYPNPEKYPNQKMYILSLQGYTYMVPFVDTENVRYITGIISPFSCSLFPFLPQ
ncbi:MAG: toxin [Candidatus Peregrinibacteria bacterium]